MWAGGVSRGVLSRGGAELRGGGGEPRAGAATAEGRPPLECGRVRLDRVEVARLETSGLPVELAGGGGDAGAGEDRVADEPVPGDLRQAADGAVRGDRKSTRLNSSHANISYAAFFLKKIC